MRSIHQNTTLMQHTYARTHARILTHTLTHTHISHAYAHAHTHTCTLVRARYTILYIRF